MSGFGILVSIAFSSMIILQVFGMIFAMSENALVLYEISRRKSPGIISFDGVVEMVSGNLVKANILNRGPWDLTSASLKNADILVVYFDDRGRRKIQHLSFLLEGQDVGWKVLDITFGEHLEEILDPSSFGQTFEGIWNVGETLHISILLPESVNNSFPVLVKLWVVS